MHISGRDEYIRDNIGARIDCSVIQVEEALRFPVPMHKPAFRVCCTYLDRMKFSVTAASFAACIVIKVVFRFVIVIFF